MATYEQYIQQGKANLNKGYDYTLQQIIDELGGLVNPTKDNFVLGKEREVTDPRLRSIAEYLNQLGAEGYQYKYEDILSSLNNATNAAYDAQLNTLADASSEYNRNMATQQDSVVDAIRNQYAQAIQTGVSRGMQSANMLSSILGNSQAAAQGAQQLAQDRYQAGVDLRAQLIQDAADALNKSNSAYETLMSNIRQLYNDEIQEKTADLEYNASILETNANYLANKYTADTNYASGILSNASGIYNNNQSALSSLLSAAAGAAAQDNYADAYLKAAMEAAAATKYAAMEAAAATKYAAGGYDGSGGGYSGGGYSGGYDGSGGNPTSDTPISTTKDTTKSTVGYTPTAAVKQYALGAEFNTPNQIKPSNTITYTGPTPTITAAVANATSNNSKSQATAANNKKIQGAKTNALLGITSALFK